MKTIKLLLLSGIIALTSCAKDPCVDTTCYNDGVCDDGTCLCADWYEGADCSVEEKAKYIGTYIGALNLYDANGVLLQGNQIAQLVNDGTAINELDGDGLPFVLTISGDGAFTIPITQISDPDLGNTFWQGSGSFNGNALAYNGTFDVGSDTYSFSFSGTK